MHGTTITLTGVLATDFQLASAGCGEAPLVSVEFEGDTIEYRHASAAPLPAPGVSL